MARTATRTSVGNVVLIITGVIAAIIALGILLVLIGANPSNAIVDLVLDVGRFFAQPFEDLFPNDDPKVNILVNWGIAALAYLLVGALIARLARR